MLPLHTPYRRRASTTKPFKHFLIAQNKPSKRRSLHVRQTKSAHNNRPEVVKRVGTGGGGATEQIIGAYVVFELETFLKMILEILNGCENLEEAKKKIKTLLER